MTALVPTSGLANSLADIFEPIDAAPIESLLAEYDARRQTIDRLAAVFGSEEARACLPYFIKGARVSSSYEAERMFTAESVERAVKALDADYWRRALDATDVLSVMPAKRREEWHKQLDAYDVPTFSAEAIRSTLGEHLASRDRYFAERVDGLFHALSPDHKTNVAAGFRSKMILQQITNDWHGATSRVDYLADLRYVVARFMGRAVESKHHLQQLTRELVERAWIHYRGEWISLDGGAVEIKLFKNGNCHVRVHDELAWRLNAVLASVNPGAIPESNRTRPAYSGKRKKAAPAVQLFSRPLPFAVVRALARFHQRSRDLGSYEWEYGYEWKDLDKHVQRETLQVLASVGAVVDPTRRGRVRFNYDATDVLHELVSSGQVPDTKAHQYYPTPPVLAERVVELADIAANETVLEPSAGQGALVRLLPEECTALCIEASALHCTVLRARGFDVVEGDFLRVELSDVGKHDVAVMNPPFDRGQWRAHVKRAARFLMPGTHARLVAILPASAVESFDLPGFTLTWSAPIDNAFAGTSISVIILVARREA